MTTVHQPVLLTEVIKKLNPQPNQDFIDCTLGGAGHTQAILERTAPKGKLLGIDWDETAVQAAKHRLIYFKSRVILVNDTYVNLKKIAKKYDFQVVKGILFDLGLSSDQLQTSGRGFSWKVNEGLDMRFSQQNELTAKIIVNKYPEDELIKIFKEFGEERYSRKIARQIVETRKKKLINTTQELAMLIYETVPKQNFKIHPATRVFQALRIAVNNELENIKSALYDAIDLLAPKGKLAVISFHSLEHRIVKQIFNELAKKCSCPPEALQCTCDQKPKITKINKKAIVPSEEEIKQNPRSRSAQLRIAQRL